MTLTVPELLALLCSARESQISAAKITERPLLQAGASRQIRSTFKRSGPGQLGEKSKPVKYRGIFAGR